MSHLAQMEQAFDVIEAFAPRLDEIPCQLHLGVFLLVRKRYVLSNKRSNFVPFIGFDSSHLLQIDEI